MKWLASIRARMRRMPTLTPLVNSERTGRFVHMALMGFLVFALGMASAHVNSFPYRVFENAIDAARILVSVQREKSGQFPEFIYYDVSERKAHRNRIDPSSAFRSVTILNYFHDDQLCLINKAGQCLHRYSLNLSEADREYVAKRFRETTSYFDTPSHFYIQNIHVFPNGDALMMFNVAGTVWPVGAGLVKVDRNSRILWKAFEIDTHHNFDVGEDGRIYALKLTRKQSPPPSLEHLGPSFLDQEIVVFNSDGNVVDRINLFDALQHSEFKFYLQLGNLVPLKHNLEVGDYLHPNDVSVITKSQAKVFPFGKEGDLLVSLRDIHAIGVLSVEQRKFTWLKRGPWVAQHDPDILPNGNLVIFDNLGGDPASGLTRVIEYDPKTDQVDWSYEGTADEPFRSRHRGSQQPLPNGNVLISESTTGRIFEVNRKEEIVWQFVSPFRFGENKEYVPAVRWPQRIALDYFTPDFRAQLRKAAETAPLLSNAAEHASG